MAIARDAYSIAGRSAGLTRTLSHTCTGSNLLLLAWVEEYGTNASDNITGVTYNGVAMTRIAFPTAAGGSVLRWYLYALLAPATGTHNIVATGTYSGSQIGIYAVSYSGVKQTSNPDVVVTQSQSNSSPLTLSLTTVADNAWFVGGVCTDGTTPTANSNCTVINNSTDNFNVFEYNSNPKTPTGSVSMSVNVSSTNNWSSYGAGVSIAPYILTTNIKSFNGLAYASTKSVNGLAIASMKTWNNLA